MKKVVLLVFGIVTITTTIVACTPEPLENEKPTILSPDKDKAQCTGCSDN
ncbi:hypothetical protein [Maribacter sp.]|nr:hypothetical protein [Maribacter sp.]